MELVLPHVLCLIQPRTIQTVATAVWEQSVHQGSAQTMTVSQHVLDLVLLPLAVLVPSTMSAYHNCVIRLL